MDASLWARLNQPIDGYCERLSPDFWAEPINAVTNIAFMLAAAALMRILARHEREAGAPDHSARALIIILWCIGFGSLAFHTFGRVWAAIADVLPIMIFILTYIYLALRRYYHAPRWRAALGIPALLIGAVLLGRLNIGIPPSYLAAGGALLALAGGLWRRAPHLARGLLAAAGVFALSLTLRTLDMPLCATNPLGTHWAWHILNGVMLFMVTKVYIGAKSFSRVI